MFSFLLGSRCSALPFSCGSLPGTRVCGLPFLSWACGVTCSLGVRRGCTDGRARSSVCLSCRPPCCSPPVHPELGGSLDLSCFSVLSELFLLVFCHCLSFIFLGIPPNSLSICSPYLDVDLFSHFRGTLRGQWICLSSTMLNQKPLFSQPHFPSAAIIVWDKCRSALRVKVKCVAR